MRILLRRVDFGVYVHNEIDPKRDDHSIDNILNFSLKTLDYYFSFPLKKDPGCLHSKFVTAKQSKNSKKQQQISQSTSKNNEPTTIFSFDTEISEEPISSILDVHATLTLQTQNQEPIKQMQQILQQQAIQQDQQQNMKNLRQLISQKLSVKMQEIKQNEHIGLVKTNKKRSMGYLNKAPDEEVDPIYPTSGAIQIQDKSNLEICEELVSQKRDQMQQIQNQQIQEIKAQIAKEKQEALKTREIANINKELYKFKRKQSNVTSKKSSKKLTIPFEETKQTGIQFYHLNQFLGSKISDYNKLTRLCGQKQFIVNPKILAGSMFDFFKEPQPGVALKENGKFKFCSQEENDFEGDEKRMSYKSYQNKIGTQGNFMSSKANPELYNLIKQTQDISYLKPNPSNQGNANASQDTLKNEFISNLKNFHDQQDYYDEARQEYQLSRLGQIDSGNLNEKDRVLLQSPQSLRQLITFKNKNAQSRNGFLTQNNSTSDLKSNATNDCKFSEQITNFQQTQTFKSLKNDQNKLKQTIQNSLRERVRNAQISLAASQSQTFDNIHQTSKISVNHVQQHPPVKLIQRTMILLLRSQVNQSQ
eukprot:403347310